MIESRHPKRGGKRINMRPPAIESVAFDGSEPLQLITAVDIAYHGIRTSILSGQFEPGMQLKLQNLGDRYSISLIPVREALRLLQAEGLVESVRNKGARVAPISLAETIDVYGLRLVLETAAMKLAFPQIDDMLIDALVDCQRDMRKIFATDRAQYLALHQKLHFAIYSRCGSKWTMRMLGLVWSHSDRWRRLALPHDVNAETEDHGPILSALKARDLRAACRALEQHIQLSVRNLQRTVLAVPGGSDDGLSSGHEHGGEHRGSASGPRRRPARGSPIPGPHP
jgi:DNA-binding GntR family transcriptional regulator